MKSAPCPLCASPSAHQITMPMDAKTFRPTRHGAIYQCERCQFRFVYPRPTPEETGAFYELDAYYTQGAGHMVNSPVPGFSSKLRTHLAWRADRSQTLSDVIRAELPVGSSIVDIGCGSGALMTEMERFGYRMTGVERDTNALSLSNLTVFEGAAETLPRSLTKGTYEGVIFSHVVEHLVDPIAAIQHAAELLSPCGKLFCEVPNNEADIAMQSGLSWEHLDVPRHINFFTERSMCVLMQRAA